MAGEGSVFKISRKRPDGTTRVVYKAQVSIGPRSDRRFVSRTRATRKQALAALNDLRDDLEARRDLSKLSLGAYLRRWLDESARPSISTNTYRGWDDVIGHLTSIADIPIADLTPEDIEGACNAMMTQRRGAASVPVAPKTVRNAQIMLRRALGQAEARGHVRRNVAKLVPLRRVPHVRREPLIPETARAILAAMAGDRYEAAYALAFVGLRAGEILGLAWSDLHLDGEAWADVRLQLMGSGKGATREPPKTIQSATPVPLPPFVVSRLKAHEAAQKVERRVVALDGGLVFVTERGYAVNGSWLTKHFQSRLADAGLPKMTIHSLRHGAASLLAAAGAQQKVAQQLLRHAQSKTTTDIYTHVSAAQEREAVGMLERVMTGAVTGAVTEPETNAATSGHE